MFNLTVACLAGSVYLKYLCLSDKLAKTDGRAGTAADIVSKLPTWTELLLRPKELRKKPNGNMLP